MNTTYKSIATKLTTSGSTFIYSGSSGTTTLLKSIYCSNITGSASTIDVYIQKSGSVDNVYIIKEALVPIQSSLQPITEPIILEARDSLYVKAGHSNRVDIFTSYVQLT